MTVNERRESGMEAARHAEGRPFRANEYAGAKLIGDVTRAELLERPDHPKIDGHRAIECECGHSTIGEHNHDVYESGR